MLLFIRTCFIVFISIYLLGNTVYGQQPAFKNFTIDNGLPSNVIYHVKQDRKGFIWTCSDAGISCFDGQRFKNYTIKDGLPDNEIIRIYEISENSERLWFTTGSQLWFVTLKGVIGYIQDGKVHRLDTLNEIIGDKIMSFAQDCDGNLLLGSQHKGIFKINNYKIIAQYFQNEQEIASGYYTCNFENDIYTFCRINKMTTIFNRSQLTIFDENGKLAIINSGAPPKSVLRDWLVPGYYITYNITTHIKGYGGIYCINKQLKNKVLIADAQMKNKTCQYVLQDKRKNLWVGTNDGVLLFQKSGESYSLKGEYLPGKRISCIYEDKENNIWLSTLGEGVFMLPSINVLTYTKLDGLSDNSISTLAVDSKGTVYAGTDNGFINIISKGGIHYFFSKKPESAHNIDEYNRIKALTMGAGDILWIGKDHNIYAFKHNKYVTYIYSAAVKSIYETFDGELWVGAASGIERTVKKIHNYNYLKGGRTTAVFEDNKEVLWFSNEEGLWSYQKGKFYNHAIDNKLLAERIVWIRSDSKGALWLATQGKGLLRMQGKHVKVFSTKEGLASDICNSFYLDNDSLLWIATNGGISKLSILTPDAEKFNIQNIGVKQGLVSDKVSSIAKSNHFVYAGTNKGLCYFNEFYVKKNTEAPRIYITGFKIWEKDTTLHAYYNLDYKKNNIKIEYSGISYKSLGNITYQYKMGGLDTSWITTQYSSASFPSLPSGKYHFLVKLTNEDGVESAAPAALTIYIAYPYWQRWWFWVLLTVGTLFLGSIIFIQRLKTLAHQSLLKQQTLQAEQKAFRAQMNPHFIFNALSSIQRFIVDKNALMAHEYLSKFGSLIRHILDNSKHTFISIQEEVETLKLYIELEALRFDNSFEYNIVIDPAIDEYSTEIPAMIIQPYVENAIWHGLLHKQSKGELAIVFLKQDNDIICNIEDNGIGREASTEIRKRNVHQLHTSVGMEITEERLKNLKTSTQNNYAVTIYDLKDEYGKATGTRVTITFSVKK